MYDPPPTPLRALPRATAVAQACMCPSSSCSWPELQGVDDVSGQWLGSLYAFLHNAPADGVLGGEVAGPHFKSLWLKYLSAGSLQRGVVSQVYHSVIPAAFLVDHGVGVLKRGLVANLVSPS